MRARIVWPIVGGLLLLVLLFAGWTLTARYNALVAARYNVDDSWARVEQQIQRRADLIPDLVESVSGYAPHETEIFDTLEEARRTLADAGSPVEAAAANAGLGSALDRLLAVAGNYPELEDNRDYRAVERMLEGTENLIAVERKRYNDAVRSYNTSLEGLPNSLLADTFGLNERLLFRAEGEATKPIKLGF